RRRLGLLLLRPAVAVSDAGEVLRRAAYRFRGDPARRAWHIGKAVDRGQPQAASQHGPAPGWRGEAPRRSAPEGFGWGAGADQVAVAVGLVDAAHRGPVLAPEVPGQRVGGLLPGVVVLPVGCQQHLRGVWRVGQRVVLPVEVAAG